MRWKGLRSKVWIFRGFLFVIWQIVKPMGHSKIWPGEAISLSLPFGCGMSPRPVTHWSFLQNT